MHHANHNVFQLSAKFVCVNKHWQFTCETNATALLFNHVGQRVAPRGTYHFESSSSPSLALPLWRIGLYCWGDWAEDRSPNRAASALIRNGRQARHINQRQRPSFRVRPWTRYAMFCPKLCPASFVSDKLAALDAQPAVHKAVATKEVDAIPKTLAANLRHFDAAQD